MLYVALTDKAKVKNEDVDSIFNFLSELAFNLYETGNDSFSGQYLEDFYVLYSSKYITKGLVKIIEILLNSNIIIEDEDGDYKFRYNYIFYFLVSRKLVDIIPVSYTHLSLFSICNCILYGVGFSFILLEMEISS